jgi:hypothetical protein
MSESLLEQFSHAEIAVHPGGHFVPSAGPQRQSYTSFLEDRKHEIEIENRRKAKQIQMGSYTLERVEDSSSERSEDEDRGDSTCEEKGRTKANKGGISKQTRRKMMQSKTREDVEVSSVPETKST